VLSYCWTLKTGRIQCWIFWEFLVLWHL